MTLERLGKITAAATGIVALAGAVVALLPSLDFRSKDILRWSPEHFEISDGYANEEFKVVVAREKLRGDCEVKSFKLEVRDAELVVHAAKPSIAAFSGPANNRVDKFAYKLRIESKNVAPGRATLLAHIYYKCPEGDVVVNYPDHPKLTFEIKRGP